MTQLAIANATDVKTLPSRAWLVVGLLFVVGALNYLDRIVIITMRQSMVDSIPMTDVQFGLLTSVFLWVYGALSPFAGFLADRFNRSLVIIISLFIWSAVTWLTAYATSFEQLLLTRALMGISEACYIPASLALIADYHRGNTRSLANSINLTGLMVGSSLGFVGGWIADKYDWTLAFIILGVIGVGYVVLLVFLLRDAPVRQQKGKEEVSVVKVNFFDAIKHLLGNGSFLLMIVFWSLLGMVGWMVMGWLPTYYMERFDLSQGIAGLYATGYLYPASLVGVLTGGYLADRWSRTNPRARILVPVIGLLIAGPCIFFASYVSILSIAILCFIVWAFVQKFSDANLMPVLCMIADDRYRATGYGILNFFACVVGGVGIYAGGLMRDSDINLSIVFQSASLLILIAATMFYLIRPKEARNST